MFLEIRDEKEKKVTFSALHMDSEILLWTNVAFDEPWWISLADTSGSLLFLKVYTDTHNPDQKSILAFDFEKEIIVWWRNNFALTAVNETKVIGTDTGLGTKLVILDLRTGQPDKEQTVFPVVRNFSLIKPLQYHQDTAHFETLRDFLKLKCSLSPVTVIEYLEFQSLLFISCFVQENDLANFLFVFNKDGEKLLEEKIGEQLKGVGIDTFFIFSETLIFVRNKSMLVTYKMV